MPYYVKDGRPTSEQDNIRQALRFLRRLYGHTPARDFGPLALKAVRQSMIEAGRCRRLINKDVHRIRAMFRWAAGEELYPGEALAALAAVEALEKGRSEAKDRPPIGPVRRGGRPGDPAPPLAPGRRDGPAPAPDRRPARARSAPIRPRDVDRSDPACWVYRPGSHKTEHHGRERVIVLGPEGAGGPAPLARPRPGRLLLQPGRGRGRARGGATALAGPSKAGRRPGPSPGGATPRTATGWRSPGPATGRSPTRRSAKVRGEDLTDDRGGAELLEWRKAHRWHPHRLRHTKATEIRRRFDTEAAQVILGHSKPDTTLIYAERDLARAREVMGRVG